MKGRHANGGGVEGCRFCLDAPIGEISNCLIVRLEDGRIALRGGWDREKALEAALREIHAAKTESGRLYAIQETRDLLTGGTDD